MVIFDRIGRDSDCSFINSSSEKNSVQIGEAPLAKLTKIHSPCLVREKSFENQNAFLQRTKPNRQPPALTCIFVVAIHGLKNIQRKFSGWYQPVNVLQDTEPWPCNEMKNGLFPASPDHKVPLMHCSAKAEVMQRGSGQENTWNYPNPPSSNKIKMVVSWGCLHRRRAWNSTTPPNKKSKLSFVIKCQLDSTIDNKTIRQFSGQFFCSFVSNILNNLSHRILCATGLRK